jgi:hypothetical protein
MAKRFCAKVERRLIKHSVDEKKALGKMLFGIFSVALNEYSGLVM